MCVGCNFLIVVVNRIVDLYNVKKKKKEWANKDVCTLAAVEALVEEFWSVDDDDDDDDVQ